MQFRKTSRPTPFLNRKHQTRMLLMFGALVLVLFATVIARDPQTWKWMFPAEDEAPVTEESGAAANTGIKPSRAVDFTVKTDEDNPLPAGVFRAQADPTGSAPSDRQREVNRIGDFVIEIDPATLSTVRDDYVGIRSGEREAFYRVLGKARDVPVSPLEKAGRDDISFVVLMTDSQQYRGLPITVEGTLRRLTKIPAQPNDHNIDEFYEGWVFTEAAGNNPYVLLAVEVPPDMPLGDELEVPVRFTGYFFKRYGYASNGGLHKAPLLIGPYLQKKPSPKSGGAEDRAANDLGMAPYVIGFAVTIALCLSLTLWWYNRGDTAFNDQHVKSYIDASPEQIAALQDLETVHPLQDLQRQLQEDSQDDS